jgi:excisionase family DNA binding protein
MTQPKKLPSYRERMRQAAESMPKWITPQVVAEALGVDDSTVHRMLKRGTIKGHNIDGPGSPVRILSTDFEDYLRTLKERSESRTLKRAK